MRIGLLHYTYAPVIGGVEQVMADHARLLRDHGHKVTVFCGEGASAAGVEVLPELRRAGGADVKRMEELLRPRLAAQEVVFLHNVCTMPFHPALTAALWALAAESRGVRFICWVHDVAAANPDYEIPRDPGSPLGLLRRASPHFEYVAVSALRRGQLEECLGVPAGQCQVIPNGLWPLEHLGVPDELAPLVEEWRLLERDLVLLHPARLLRRKNVEFSLEVLAALRAHGRDASLLVTAPEDPHHPASRAYAEELRQLRRELGLEAHACFVSEHLVLSDTALRSLYRLADAVLFPSRQEGFGLPILEAALQRVPIFCPDVEPLRSILQRGPIRYPTASSPEQVAALVRQQTDGSMANQARREVFRGYPCGAIYRNFIAPLLEKAQSSPPYP